jgi:hypothetical protein
MKGEALCSRLLTFSSLLALRSRRCTGSVGVSGDIMSLADSATVSSASLTVYWTQVRCQQWSLVEQRRCVHLVISSVGY